MGMTILLVVVSGAYGFFIARMWERTMRESARKVNPARSFWERLPSGWTRDVNETITIYATMVDGIAYWWVSRNGRTVIEGPSASLDVAKIEAEREAHELTRL